MTLRGVLVGCGWIAPSHLRAWSVLADVRIEALVDIDQHRAEALRHEFGVDRVFSEAGAALAAVRPDFIDIATGPDSHAALTELGVTSGCHVLCQKPLAFDLADAERIVRAERESGTLVAVNEMWKWLPAYREICRLVREGILGAIREARFQVATNLLLPELDGSAPERLRAGGQMAFREQHEVLLVDYGMHPLDLLRTLLGRNAVVTAATVSRVSPALKGDDGSVVMLRFASGATATVELDWSRPGPRAGDTIEDETLVIAGSEGVLASIAARTVTWYPRTGEGWTRTFDGDRRQAAFIGSQGDFVQAVRDRRPPASPPSDHIENLRLALTAYAMAGWS